MKISILTLFPQMFTGPFDHSIVKRAREKGLVEILFVNIRDFGTSKHKVVDDKPYGGGVGMILKVDVLYKVLHYALNKKLTRKEQKVILLSATGKTYDQKMARDFSRLSHLIIISGHYEGVDERILKFVDRQVSIGDFVLTGGEIPAMVIVDSVTRLIPGVLKKDATESESFSQGLLEYPQYTRPENFAGLKVPEVLLSGNHKKIAKWKEKESIKKTGDKHLKRGRINSS